jgi:hypothetical protein
LGQFHLARKLIGATSPIGAGAPTQLPCDAQTVLRDVQHHFLMAVATVKCGSINPSASNLSLLIQPTQNQHSRPSKTCSWDCWCRGHKTWHLVGAAGPSLGHVWPAVASCSRLWPSCDRLWCGGAWQSCGRTWPGAAGPTPLLWCTPLWFICPLLFPYMCT